MSPALFVCNLCDCVDHVELAHAGTLPIQPEAQLCTECQTGVWHDQFPKEPYDPALDNVVNRPTGLSL